MSLSFGDIPGGVRRRRTRLRQARRRQSRLSHTPATFGAAHDGFPDEGKGLRLLDAGCGTGASTAALLAVAPKAEIVAVDASARHAGTGGRESHGRRRCASCTAASRTSPKPASADRSTASWPPTWSATSPTRTDSCSAFRAVLRPGGTLAVHEYSVRDSRLATAVWNTVCATIIIPSGRLRSGDAALYKYLRRSVNRFDGAAAFRDRLRANGFEVGA